MTELKDVLAKPAEADSVFRVARVISVSGHSLTVDFLSGAAGTVIQAGDTCNPRPDDNVLIAMFGNRPVALQVLGGPYRQAILTAVSETSTTVTGVLNGVSTAVTKIGAFTSSPGDQLPLKWADDGSGVWVLAKAGVTYIPPTGGGGGGGGGGSTPGSYTSYYAATSSGTHYSSGSNSSGDLNMYAGDVLAGAQYGYYRYGFSRFAELSGKTILSGSIYLPLKAGGGSPRLMVGSGPSYSTVGLGGWASLSSTRISELIGYSSIASTEVHLTNNVSGWQVRGIPSGGTVQITWR